MRVLLALGVLATSISYGQSTVVTDKRLASLDTAFQRVLKTWRAAGFAVAVVEKDKVIYAKGFGYRDVEKKLPVTPNTLFAIGSCTKAFTTSLIGMLQQEGKLDIDHPAHEYFADLNFFTNDLTNAVSLRDMMSHRTGLPRHDYSWYLFNTGDRDSLVRRIRYQEPTFPLRRTWQYNNFMFVAQGSVIEKLTGKSWEENVKEKIFQPLNMSQSMFSILDMGKAPDAAKGYGLKKDSIINELPYYNINAAGPAGSINSSVLDMSKWVTTWIYGGRYKDKDIIPSSFAREAISSQSVVGSGFPTKEKPELQFANYGFGWSLSAYKGHYRVEHGGNIDGFSASTCFFPTDSIGIIVLTNQNGSSIPSIVRNLISDRLLGKAYYDWNSDMRKSVDASQKEAANAAKVKRSNRKPGTKPSHDLKEYNGFYKHPGYGVFDVYENKDSLFARTPTRLLYLRHYHYDIFEPVFYEDIDNADGEGDVRIEFNTGINGDIESLNVFGIESNDIQLRFTKSDKVQTIAQDDLKIYAGDYQVSTLAFTVVMQGTKLMMIVPGQPEYELQPTGNDKFSVKNVAGYSVKFIREGNKVTAIDLIQPNGTFRATKK